MEIQDKTKDQLIEELRIHQMELETQNEELKRAYAELEESRNRFSDLYDLAPVGYLTVSDTGMIVDANLKAAHLLGLERSRLINSPFSRFVLIEDQDIFYLHRNNCLDQLTKQTCELTMVNSDGKEFSAQLESMAVAGDEEPPRGLRTAIIDITERRRMETLAETANEARFRSIFENSLDAILLVTPEGQILDANDSACQMFGRTLEELREVGRDQLMDPGDSRIAAAFERYRQEGHWKGEFNNRRKDGTAFPVEVAVKSFEDASGRLRDVAVIRDVTERVRAQEALLQSEVKYRLIFSTAPAGIMHFDSQGIITDCNEKFAEILGASREQVMGFNLLTGLKNEDVKEAISQALSGKVGTYEGDYTSVTGGRTRFGKITYAPFNVTGTQCSGGVAIADDFTERKLVEDALRVSEERFRLMVEKAPLAMLVASATGQKIEYLNPTFIELFGYTIEDVPDVNEWRRLAYPDEEYRSWVVSEANRRVAIAVTNRTATESLEVEVTCKDGSEKIIGWVLVTVGEKAVVFGIDLTERKQAEHALRKSEQTNRLLIERSPVGIAVWRGGEDLVFVNPAIGEVFGYTSQDELPGHPVETFVHPNDVGLVKQRVKERLQGIPVPTHYEVQGLKKNGTPFDLAIWPAVIEYDGKPAILTFCADRSEAKSLRNQLFHSQKMEAIGTLAGGVAHDFNNILQVVLGYTELLLSDKASDHPDLPILEIIKTSASRGADLVQRLLIFSRKGAANPRPLNLNTEVAQTVKLLERTIKMMAIELHLEENLSTVNADPVQIEQILMNLAVNAKDATPQEGGRLAIETENVNIDDVYCRLHAGAKPGPHVMLTVSDTGCGMGEDIVQHIFEPFFTTKDAGKGTGLGLSVVFGIVEQHGGHITCQSVLGQGTTFRIYFPVAADESHATKRDAGIAMGGSETILLVDDEPEVLDVGALVLTGAGYTVLRAASGPEAIEMYRTGKAEISLVILDLIMPKMGGIQCYHELKRINLDVRVLISSGLISGGTVKDAEQLGARGFVQKPYDGVKLLNMVRESLDAD